MRQLKRISRKEVQLYQVTHFKAGEKSQIWWIWSWQKLGEVFVRAWPLRWELYYIMHHAPDFAHCLFLIGMRCATVHAAPLWHCKVCSQSHRLIPLSKLLGACSFSRCSVMRSIDCSSARRFDSAFHRSMASPLHDEALLARHACRVWAASNIPA